MLALVVVGTVIGMTMLVNLPREVSMAALGVFVLTVSVSNLVRAVGIALAASGLSLIARALGG